VVEALIRCVTAASWSLVAPPVTLAAVIAYGPTTLCTSASVVRLGSPVTSLVSRLCPFTQPVIVAENTGFAAPYARPLSFAFTVNSAGAKVKLSIVTLVSSALARAAPSRLARTCGHHRSAGWGSTSQSDLCTICLRETIGNTQFGVLCKDGPG